MRSKLKSLSAILLATVIATSARACETSVVLAGGSSALVLGQSLFAPPTVIIAQHQFAVQRQIIAQRQVIVQRPRVVVRPLVARPLVQRPLIVPRRAVANPLIIVH